MFVLRKTKAQRETGEQNLFLRLAQGLQLIGHC